MIRRFAAPASRSWLARAWSAAPSTAATPASTSPREVSVDGESLTAEQIFINVGGRAVVPDMPGLDDVTFLTNSYDDRRRLRPAPSDRHRRQLHRARIRADVPALRQRGHRRRDGPRAWSRREDEDISDADPRNPGGEGIAVRTNASASASPARRRRRRRRRLHRPVRRGESAATSCSPSAARRTPTTSVSIGRASTRMSVASSRSTTNCGPMSPASGRSATAMAGVPSRIRPITTSRSSPPTCSTVTPARCRDRIPATPSMSTRRSAASA